MTKKLPLVLAAALAWGNAASPQDQLPKPDRMGVVNTGPYDYGVMGPPATPAIVAAADKAVAKPMPRGPFHAIYAIVRAWPNSDAVIAALAKGGSIGEIKLVTLMGHAGPLSFTPDESGLRIQLPAEHAAAAAYTFKIWK